MNYVNQLEKKSQNSLKKAHELDKYNGELVEKLKERQTKAAQEEYKAISHKNLMTILFRERDLICKQIKELEN